MKPIPKLARGLAALRSGSWTHSAAPGPLRRIFANGSLAGIKLRGGRLRPLRAGFWGLVALGASQFAGLEGGIPEPDLVMYGVIRNTSGGLNIRVTAGELAWTFQPSGGGTSITITTALRNINDQFSYILRVPCETAVSGIAASSGTLTLGSSFNRSQVKVAGVQAVFVEQSQQVLSLGGNDRGRMERVDLEVSLGSSGLLPEDWQIQYFGQTGVDPFDDADGDGVNNFDEYRAGTNPRDPDSLFEVRISDESPGGPRLEWISAEGKVYTIYRSEDLTTGFEVLESGIPATPPTNTYQDETAAGGETFFYRVSVGP